jgi:uncharacterized membrane protein
MKAAKPLIAAAFLLGAVSSAQAQTWSLTGNMNATRSGGHTATLLSNGEVLVTGGEASNAVLSSSELYNPSAGTFSYTGSMNTARAYHGAVLLPNGNVLVVGGESSISPATCLSSAELYNPSTGTFSYTASLTTAMCGTTATMLQDGKVLVTNGATAELYDPSTGTFSVTGSLQVSRGGASVTLLGNGKVLVAGGVDASSNCPTYLPDCNTLESAELYDPSTGTFTLTGSMQAARFDHTATLMSNGEVLIAGGEYYYQVPNPPGPPLTESSDLNEAELYNPATGTFTITQYMNVARAGQVAALLPSGKVMVASGRTAEIYDPSSGTFTLSAAGLNDERDSGEAAVLLNSGSVLVIGGYWSVGTSKPHGWNTAEIFDPTVPNWTFSVTPAASNTYPWNVALGQPASFLLTVTPTNGFAGNVSLSAPQPPEATATLSTNTIPNGSGTSTWTVTPTTTNTPGDFYYYAEATATSGGVTQTLQVTLGVNSFQYADFSLNTTPILQTVLAGNGASYALPVTPQNGFAGNVSLSLSGLPAGANATFNPNPVPNGSGTSILTVTTTSSTAPGNYIPSITATSGSLSHGVLFDLVVNAPSTPDFSLSATPASETVVHGNGTSYALSVTPSNGFEGNVSLSLGPLPEGVNATFNTNPVPNASGTSTLTVTTTSSTAPGNYTIPITGTSGSLTKSALVTLVVNAASTPDFSLSATPASQTVAAGNGTGYTVTLTPSGGFAGNVSLSLGALPAGVNATFSTNPILNGSGTSTLNVTTTSSTAPGTYNVMITGTSGSLTHSATVTLVVNAASAPDFSLSATPASQTVTRGNGTSYALSLTPSNGFASNVSLSLGALPAGVNASFSTNPIPNGSGTSTLNVTTTSSTAPGTYTLTITGTSGSLTHSTSVTLRVRR